MFKSIRFRLAGFILKVIVKTIYRTCRKKTIGSKEFFGDIIGVYHGQLFALPTWFADHGYDNHDGQSITIMVSKHKDGEYLHHAIKSFGGDTIRGDSRHDSVYAMRKIIKRIRDGYTCVFAVDGPVGPNRSIQPGIIQSSLFCKKPIRMMFTASNKPMVFQKAWDKFFIPRPFSRINIYISDTYFPDLKLTIEENIKKLKEFSEQEEKKFICSIC